jgi:nitrogen regulatory protein PII-like uncharacterized protein
MSKVISLFSDQEQAGRAIEALAAAGFEDAEIHEIEGQNPDLEPQPLAVAPIHQGGYGAVTPIPFSAFLSDLGDSEAEQFLKRNLESGGVVIVVEPSDEEASTRIKRILEEEGGQVV